jgi:plasmid rolling circle replication initiator protein Rep
MAKVSLSNVVALLEVGTKRKAIQEQLELTGAEMRVLFNHPKIKGLRAKRTIVEIIDDLGGSTDEVDNNPNTYDDAKIPSSPWLDALNIEPINVNQQILFPEMEEVNY